MRVISNLDLKIQLTNEYLRTDGLENIPDIALIQDLINVKIGINGKAIPETITPRLNAFMLAILHSNTLPPFHIDNQIIEYGSFIQKSTCFDQFKIDSKEQIDELFEKYKNSKNILFRGQREAKWRLYSKLQRFWIWDKIDESSIDYLDFLKGLIEIGREGYQAQIISILSKINIDSLNDISVLGYLQHHNCPTPLLDWTYNFTSAMFFGVDGLEIYDSPREIDNYFSIYFIKEDHFDNCGMRTLLSESLQKECVQKKLELITQIAKDEKQRVEMEEHFRERSFFDKNRINGAGLIKHMNKIEHMINIPFSYFSDNDNDTGIAFSITNSENIKRQNGVFTWNSHRSKPLEVIGNELYVEAKIESEPNDYRFCECYNINKYLAEYLLLKLTETQITKETIYPDMDIDTRHVYDKTKKTIKRLR